MLNLIAVSQITPAYNGYVEVVMQRGVGGLFSWKKNGPISSHFSSHLRSLKVTRVDRVSMISYSVTCLVTAGIPRTRIVSET